MNWKSVNFLFSEDLNLLCKESEQFVNVENYCLMRSNYGHKVISNYYEIYGTENHTEKSNHTENQWNHTEKLFKR